MRLLFGLMALAVFGWGAPASAQQNPSFNLVNRGSVPIRELFFTPAGDANWGRNRLAGAAIPPGASYPARRRMDGNCIFDIRVVFADGHHEDRRGLNTCTVDDVAFGAGPVTTAGGKAPDDPSFRLVNHGAQPITEIHVVRSGTEGWGENRIGPGPLPPQTDRPVHVDRQGCSFDLRVVFADGHAKERRHADLCRMTDLPVP